MVAAAMTPRLSVVGERKMQTGQSKLAAELVRLLGLPKHTTAFELRVAHDEVIGIKCQFHPEMNDGEVCLSMEPILAEYTLIPAGGAAGKAPRWFDSDSVVQRLRLRPDDRVVVRVPGVHLVEEQRERLRQLVRTVFPDHAVLVLDAGAELGVVGPAGPEEAPHAGPSHVKASER